MSKTTKANVKKQNKSMLVKFTFACETQIAASNKSAKMRVNPVVVHFIVEN